MRITVKVCSRVEARLTPVVRLWSGCSRGGTSSCGRGASSPHLPSLPAVHHHRHNLIHPASSDQSHAQSSQGQHDPTINHLRCCVW